LGASPYILSRKPPVHASIPQIFRYYRLMGLAEPNRGGKIAGFTAAAQFSG
jgi:hypothetical protein